VLPGGGVDATDADPESALRRELNEELAARAEISRLIHVVERDGVTELVYAGRALEWAFDRRFGPEFGESGRGSYELEVVPLSLEGLMGIDLKPASVADMLQRAVRVGQSPLDLPDLDVEDYLEQSSDTGAGTERRIRYRSRERKDGKARWAT
jgi:8-oxo-dGTP pyrophosphatase MutT (NUDIX family)